MLDKQISNWNVWDLHVHTSNTIIDNDCIILGNTLNERAENFINAMIKEDVSLFVMTDHMEFNNDLYEEINKIIKQKKYNLTVIPGMEINVDVSLITKMNSPYVQLLVAVNPNEVTLLNQIHSELQQILTKTNRSITLKKFLELFAELKHVCYWEFSKSRGIDKRLTKPQEISETSKLVNMEFIYALNIPASPNDIQKIETKISKFITGKIKNNIIKFTASDNHDISNYPYGKKDKNGNNGKKWFKTWFKAVNSFSGLQYAFTEHSRIKLNGDIDPATENNISFIKELSVYEKENKIELRFLENLNSIVGSRSTGKSILLKILASKTGHDLKKKSISDYIKKFNSKITNNITKLSNYLKSIEIINKILKDKKIYDLFLYRNKNINNFSKSLNLLSNINKLLNIDSKYSNEINKLTEINNTYNHLITQVKDTIENLKKIMQFNQQLAKPMEINYIKKIEYLKDFLVILETDKSLYITKFENFNKAYQETLKYKREYLNNNSLKSSEIVNNIFAGKENDIIRDFTDICKNYKLIKDVKFINEMKIIDNFKTENISKYNLNNSIVNIKNIEKIKLKFNLFDQLSNEIRLAEFKKDNIKEWWILKLILEKDFIKIFKKDWEGILKKFLNNPMELKDSISEKIEISVDGKNFQINSPGKRAETLLNILLSNNETIPLLIDQPEDNLDNKYISKELTKKIKILKEKRQIICVSHSSNIVINSDSENIIFSDINDEDKINYIFGAIEHSNHTQELMEILEGGEIALKNRYKKLISDM